jgi:hypothetical protein
MGIVSGEAIRAWMSLADAHAAGDPALRENMAKDLAKLDALRMGAITPLLFHPLADMDDPVPVRSGASVAFDLLGDGSGGRWSWPEAGAALLVWDPGQNGTVHSGADLFGGYTWQMPWRDGFEALRVLDRNRDGRIDGIELSGISAWFDDENPGHVDVGEVPTLGELGVAAIQLDAVAFEGDAALVWHPAGIRFADGKSVPLWDWLAQPVP